MSRPIKEGLDYFPLDCVMDNKIEALESEYGIEGFGVYIRILQTIYQTPNGELKTKDMGFSMWKILGKRCGKPEEYITKCVNHLLSIGLFDKNQFNETGVLTSNGIQKRFRTVLFYRENDRKRKGEFSARITCSKVKESKVKISPQDFLSSLKTNEAYKHINIEHELLKMDTWLSRNPGRKKTPRFVLAWLNKIEAPLPNSKKQEMNTL